MNDFQFLDNLPTNLLFVDDGTALVAFVSDSGITSNDLAGSLDLAVGAGANVTGSAPVTPTFPLTDDQTGSSNSTSSDPDVFLSGTNPYFKFGEVINNDNDANSEYVVVEFNALVMNTSTQDTGDRLRNNFDIRVGGSNLRSQQQLRRLRARAADQQSEQNGQPDNGRCRRRRYATR